MATPTILVVDDSRAILATMKEALSSAGYDVLTADDGDRAIALIMSRKPDLIVSDIQMPNLDGFFLCQLLKARPETRNIPFMFLTALDGVPKRLQGLEMGADDYIPKPFDRDEVVLRVRNLLARVGKGPAPQAAKGPVAGTVADTPLADLLQMVSLDGKSARISLIRGGGSAEMAGAATEAARFAERGEIVVSGERVLSAAAGPQIGLKAAFRLFTWSSARFSLEELTSLPPRVGPDLGDVEDLTMTALFQRIEHDELLAKLGGEDVLYREWPEHEVLESQIDANGKYVMLLVQRYKRVGTVCDESGLTDLDTLKSLVSLRQAGVLQLIEGEASA
ncbi:MAG: response regulator [Deltaproteobacteria bacterium]|nr:response regulator [Deltaproteobacteria bacterium]